jgi:hypothetical protein
MTGLGVGRELFPDRAILCLRPGALLCRATCFLRRRGGLTSSIGGRKTCVPLRPEPSQFVCQCSRGVRRRPWWLKRSGSEGAVLTKRAMEPDSQLPCDLERRERGRMVAHMLVSGLVPDPAEIVEEVEPSRG